MKIYFAGSWTFSKDWLDDRGGNPITNRLVSFAYAHQFEQWLEVTGRTEGNMILDSGAYSVWNNGKEIDIDEYVEYAHECIGKGHDHNKKVRVVNLDVIPGKSDQMKRNIIKPQTRKMIDKAASQGFENMQKMIKNGITPIHVFHQHEDFKWLDKMLEHTDYIGISSSKNIPKRRRRKWIRSVFNHLSRTGANVRTHGFGITSIRELKQYPWTTVDSTTWRMVAAHGNVMWPVGGLQKGKILCNSDFNIIPISKQISRRGVGGITEGVIKSFEKEGYSYENLQDDKFRYLINAKVFLKMERDLNTYKKTAQPKPKKSLF